MKVNTLLYWVIQVSGKNWESDLQTYVTSERRTDSKYFLCIITT